MEVNHPSEASSTELACNDPTTIFSLSKSNFLTFHHCKQSHQPERKQNSNNKDATLCLEESSTKAQSKDSIKDNNPKNMQRSRALDNESNNSSPSSLYPVASSNWSPPSSPTSPQPPSSSPSISPNYNNIHSLVNTPVCLFPFLVVSGSATNQPLATTKFTTPTETKVRETQEPSHQWQEQLIFKPQ